MKSFINLTVWRYFIREKKETILKVFVPVELIHGVTKVKRVIIVLTDFIRTLWINL
jgi:hypothetical protein